MNINERWCFRCQNDVFSFTHNLTNGSDTMVFMLCVYVYTDYGSTLNDDNIIISVVVFSVLLFKKWGLGRFNVVIVFIHTRAASYVSIADLCG